MNSHDALSTLLPPTRDDEPASLRQDILDELGDHLACAYNRELFRGVGSSVARQRVLERFGDPAVVARRLWLDAMKGKIMSQRALIATCFVLTVASLSLVGLVWAQSSRAAAQSAEANRKLAEALAHAQSTNKDMLSQLSEMSEAIRNSRSLDWNPVKFMLNEDSPDGPPVVGCSISLYLADGGHKQILRTSDALGIADFGLLNPGEYSVQVSRSWTRGNQSGSGQLVVGPGSKIDRRIVFPKNALKPVALDVRCHWPTDLEKGGLVVDAAFRFVPIEKDGTWWSFHYGMGTATHFILFGPGDALREVRNPSGLYLWANSQRTTFADVLTGDLSSINEPAEPPKWERGAYQLSELIVLRPLGHHAGNAGRQRFEVLVRCYPWHPNFGNYGFRQDPPTDEDLRATTRAEPMSGSIAIPGLVLPKESWSNITTRFDARPDRVNEWTISLPDELIKAVREKQKADKSTKPQLP
jgi:hypothetical protein